MGIRTRFTTAADLIMELRKAKNEGHLDKALNTYKKFQLTPHQQYVTERGPT